MSRAPAVAFALLLVAASAGAEPPPSPSPWFDRAAAIAARESGQSIDRAREVARVSLSVARGDERRAAWLLAHAIVESDLRATVERCEIVGQLGELGLWQERGGRRCRPLAEQARSAVYRLEIAERAGRDLAKAWGGLRVERRRELAGMIGGW